MAANEWERTAKKVIHSCINYVQMCMCVSSLDGTQSSIKEMFGLITHDIAQSLCGGRSVTCPTQLLFTSTAALHNTGVQHRFVMQNFGTGVQICGCKSAVTLRLEGTHAARIVIY